MRVGTNKRSASEKAVKEVMSRTVKQKHVGSPAFDLNDPVQRLMYTIGSGFFGENKFYDSLQPKDAQGHRTAKGKRSSYKGKMVVNTSNVKNRFGFNESAQGLIQTMREIAQDPERFEDLFILARWAREDLNLRQTPLMALVIAARVESELGRGSGLVRKYAPLILRRADEPKRAFAAYRHLFMEGKDGMRKGTLPKQFARGLIDSLRQFNEYQILKYDSKRESPTFKELALLLARYEGRGKGQARRSNMRPFSSAMAKYLIEGTVDEKALPKVAAREKLFKLKTWGPRAQKYAKDGDVTWENLISQFGSSTGTWEWLIENRQLPYMATLRNLRNFEQVGISEDAWDRVYNMLTADVNHRQMPFRFLAARNEVQNQTAMSAVDVALDKSVQNVPGLSGKTFIMVDVSGSMDQAVSKRSKMTCKDVGLAMAAIVAKRCGRNAVIGLFGSNYKKITFSEADSVMRIVQNMQNQQHDVGWSTNAYLALKWLLGERDAQIMTPRSKPLKVDRVVVVSDMNCYNTGGYGYGRSDSLPALLTKYRKTVNPKAFYYSLNISGGDQAQMDPQDDRTLLMSGWSEKVFQLLEQFEEPVDSSVSIPTIDALRRKFSYTNVS